jgi:hypothetical protein
MGVNIYAESPDCLTKLGTGHELVQSCQMEVAVKCDYVQLRRLDLNCDANMLGGTHVLNLRRFLL